jgi:hypothetical protein
MKRFSFTDASYPEENNPKASWSQDQLKATLAAVGNVKKIREIGRQFDIYEATVGQRLKLNRPVIRKHEELLLKSRNEICATTCCNFQTCFMGILG